MWNPTIRLSKNKLSLYTGMIRCNTTPFFPPLKSKVYCSLAFYRWSKVICLDYIPIECIYLSSILLNDCYRWGKKNFPYKEYDVVKNRTVEFSSYAGNVILKSSKEAFTVAKTASINSYNWVSMKEMRGETGNSSGWKSISDNRIVWCH